MDMPGQSPHAPSNRYEPDHKQVHLEEAAASTWHALARVLLAVHLGEMMDQKSSACQLSEPEHGQALSKSRQKWQEEFNKVRKFGIELASQIAREFPGIDASPITDFATTVEEIASRWKPGEAVDRTLAYELMGRARDRLDTFAKAVAMNRGAQVAKTLPEMKVAGPVLERAFNMGHDNLEKLAKRLQDDGDITSYRFDGTKLYVVPATEEAQSKITKEKKSSSEGRSRAAKSGRSNGGG